VKYKHSTAVTDDLRAEMEGASKQQLGWFFDQWLRRPGYPEITATWRYDSTAHEVIVDLAQGGPFGKFQFPLTVAVSDSSGASRRATAQLSATGSGAAQVRIPLASAPATIVVDPDVELLARFHVAP
jgi:aminopeptidase N